MSGSAAELIEVENPATGELLATLPCAGEHEVAAAVEAACRAFEGHWRDVPARERGELLFAVAERVRENAAELAELLATEMGKPLDQAARFDMVGCVNGFRYFGGLADKIAGDALRQGPLDVYTVYEPYGVVGAILPFNWPPLHVAGKTASALAAGNTVVLKAPEQAPLTVLRIVELMQEVLPAGVVNAVVGRAEAGAAIVSHPLVRKVSFTGSTAVGRAVMSLAAENITGTLLELGGKNPLVVFGDADIECALTAAIEGGFYNQGEACTASSRVLVHESLHDEFAARFAAAVARLRVGDPLAAGTHVGPMVTRAHQQRVQGYVELGTQEGARVLAQALLPTEERLEAGFFVAPTLFGDVTSAMRIFREEIFGPVVGLTAFASYEEAIELANDTEYGLVAGVITADMGIAHRAARDIEAGVVMVNNYKRGYLGSPFGGMKASGLGRESAMQTVLEFLEVKNVRFPSGREEIPSWSAVADVLHPRG
jgi:acyl-CoA reductase-like NAD-dependent aldehyde dehydrogenase